MKRKACSPIHMGHDDAEDPSNPTKRDKQGNTQVSALSEDQG